MKQTALFTVALAGWLAVVGTVASCGDDDEEDRKTTDTGTGDDTDTENQDTATTDTTEGTDSEVEVPQCKSEGFAPLVETARVSTIFGVEYLGFSSDSMPYDQLVVRMKMVEMRYPEAGTYALEGADLSTCTNCVIAGKSCSNDGCEKLYVGTFGDIVAQSVGPYKKAMKGILSGVIMEEVEQDPNTGVTSVKPGGDVWCLDNFEYDATVLSFADGTCPRPGINCVGETVPDFTMTSCDSGQDVSMAELTQDKKAVLYVLVTGWCYYCTEWMPEVVPYAEALLESGLEVVYVFGENKQEEVPTMKTCAAYANQYSEYSEAPLVSKFYMDHDGVSPFAHFFEAMWYYPSGDGAFGTPFNTIVNAQTSEFVWYGAGAVGVDTMDSYMSELLGL